MGFNFQMRMVMFINVGAKTSFKKNNDASPKNSYSDCHFVYSGGSYWQLFLPAIQKFSCLQTRMDFNDPKNVLIIGQSTVISVGLLEVYNTSVNFHKQKNILDFPSNNFVTALRSDLSMFTYCWCKRFSAKISNIFFSSDRHRRSWTWEYGLVFSFETCWQIARHISA